jgi:hypothetical protein
MSQDFEIIVYINQTRIDHIYATKENVITQYINTCEKYIDPDIIDENDVTLDVGYRFMCYKNKKGNELIMLVGLLTDNLISDIKLSLKMIYIQSCEDCGVIISKHYCICNVCRETMINNIKYLI